MPSSRVHSDVGTALPGGVIRCPNRKSGNSLALPGVESCRARVASAPVGDPLAPRAVHGGRVPRPQALTGVRRGCCAIPVSPRWCQPGGAVLGTPGMQGWDLPEAAEGAGARAAGESAFVPGSPARPPKHARLSEIAAELGDRPLGPAPLTSPLHRPQCGRQACRSGFPVLRADRPPVHGALTWCVVFPPAGLLQWWLLPCAGPGSGAPPGNRPRCLLHRRRSSELTTLA